MTAAKGSVACPSPIRQDGALMVNIGEPQWAAYFAAFEQQLVPTDELGNPAPNGKPI